jgi:hypothetical protein
MPKDWRTVRIELSAAGGYVLSGSGQNAFVLPDPDQLVFAETDWKRMREAAERAAGDAVDELRAWYKTAYERIGYGAAWEGWKRDCERLALWLTGRVEPSGRADKESLRRMAERIRVDPPGKRSHTNSAI